VSKHDSLAYLCRASRISAAAIKECATIVSHPPELRSIPALLALHAQTRGSHVFLLDERGALTYAQAHAEAAVVGSMLTQLGVERGAHVAVMLPNRREFVLSWFGIAMIGAVEVPVSPGNSVERLIHILNHSRCRVLVVQAADLGQLINASDLRHLEHVVVVDEIPLRIPTGLPFELHQWASVLAGAPSPSLSATGLDVAMWDQAAVMYTSGSTGPAKGAMLSHGHHYMNGYQAAVSAGITGQDVIYVAMPLHHNMAQGYGVMPALVVGATVRMAVRFDREEFWADVNGSGATILPFVGAMLVLLAKNPDAPDDADNTLRVGFGVPIPAGIKRPFEKRFGLRLLSGYGSTEASIVAWNTDEDDDSNAVGRIFPGYEVRVVDGNDLPVAAGARGEICVRANEPYAMFSGYLDDPAKTAQATRNLWFHTGDRGWFDEQGRLWFSDRMGDVIRCKGENISAYEIEQVLTTHSAVSLVAAYGVPSELGDEEIAVAVIPRAGHDLTAAELSRWSGAHMPKYMRPRYIDLVDELPLTPTGKVEKYRLRGRGIPTTAFDALQPPGPTN
jgi:crotonobetaine/carnitine-CoA ligase